MYHTCTVRRYLLYYLNPSIRVTVQIIDSVYYNYYNRIRLINKYTILCTISKVVYHLILCCVIVKVGLYIYIYI